MNAEERTLIAGLFDRMKSAGQPYRDPEADAYITEQVARQPYAPYAMAQTLIVQNQALEAAQARIAALERQVADAGEGGREASPWGPRASEAMGAPAGFGRGASQGYGQQADRERQDPSLREQPYGAPSYGTQSYGAPQQPSRGGGFLSTALQTAAGVAGGALLFSGIQSMFGGHEAQAATPAAPVEPPKALDPSSGTDAGAAAPDAGPDAGGGGWFDGLTGGGDAGADDGGNDDWT